MNTDQLTRQEQFAVDLLGVTQLGFASGANAVRWMLTLSDEWAQRAKMRILKDTATDALTWLGDVVRRGEMEHDETDLTRLDANILQITGRSQTLTDDERACLVQAFNEGYNAGAIVEAREYARTRKVHPTHNLARGIRLQQAAEAYVTEKLMTVGVPVLFDDDE